MCSMGLSEESPRRTKAWEKTAQLLRELNVPICCGLGTFPPVANYERLGLQLALEEAMKRLEKSNEKVSFRSYIIEGRSLKGPVDCWSLLSTLPSGGKGSCHMLPPQCIALPQGQKQ